MKNSLKLRNAFFSEIMFGHVKEVREMVVNGHDRILDLIIEKHKLLRRLLAEQKKYLVICF